LSTDVPPAAFQAAIHCTWVGVVGCHERDLLEVVLLAYSNIAGASAVAGNTKEVVYGTQGGGYVHGVRAMHASVASIGRTVFRFLFFKMRHKSRA